MKKISVEKTITETKYEAFDGRVFEKEEDCKKWEDSYEATLEKSIKSIKILETNAADCYLDYGNYDDEVWILKPKNLEEITLINAYITYMTGEKAQLTANMINKHIAINFGYCKEWVSVYVLEDHIEHVVNAIQEHIDNYENKE